MTQFFSITVEPVNMRGVITDREGRLLAFSHVRGLCVDACACALCVADPYMTHECSCHRCVVGGPSARDW